LIVLLFLGWSAFAQTGHTHEGEVGKFYQSWRQPLNRDGYGNRTVPCCGGQDCRPILEMRKNENGQIAYPSNRVFPSQWKILIKVPYDNVPMWVAVPDAVWEDNQPDPRDSPDGRGHACLTYSGYITCAVRAPGL
jgi:hypothetical protein